jgi:hypothetical protein
MAYAATPKPWSRASEPNARPRMQEERKIFEETVGMLAPDWPREKRQTAMRWVQACAECLLTRAQSGLARGPVGSVRQCRVIGVAVRPLATVERHIREHLVERSTLLEPAG